MSLLQWASFLLSTIHSAATLKEEEDKVDDLSKGRTATIDELLPDSLKVLVKSTCCFLWPVSSIAVTCERYGISPTP
jgi:hypothetical protein